VIEGVVSGRSQGGWGGEEGHYDVHCFEFADWRMPGGTLAGTALTLMRPVPPFKEASAQGRNVFTELPEYSVQRLSVLLSTNTPRRAIVEKVLLLKSPDPELRALSEKLQEPVIIKTKRFGDLVQNPAIGWYEGTVHWNRKPVKVQFERDKDNGIAGALKTAEALWADQSGWKRKVEAYAVAKLLRLKNESWLGDNEKELTAKQFLSRMKLETIGVEDGGRFEFWHHDGDLFWGHSIQICGNLKKGLTLADIPG
jgi:hypothetical protein